MEIPANVLRLLSDVKPDNRKRASVEIERLSRDYISTKRDLSLFQFATQLKGIVDSVSSSVSAKAGALMGLASVVLGMSPAISSPPPTEWNDMLQKTILPPIISSLNDPTDSRIRYYAIESLYNISKVIRTPVLLYFNELFDALSKLVADNESGVNTSAQIMDRLLKDIISSQPLPAPVETVGVSNVPPAGSLRQRYFNLQRFIPLIRERIHVINPSTRIFILQWLSTLDSLPDVELDDYLSDFLGGLLLYLADPNPDVTQMTSTVLGRFTPTKNLDDIVSILLQHISGGPAAETSLLWLLRIASQKNLAPLLPQLLPALAGPHRQTVQAILSKITDLDVSLTPLLMNQVSHETMDVRLASLRLLDTLTTQHPEVKLQAKPLLALLVADPNDAILKQTLALLSRQSTTPESINVLLTGLMDAKTLDKQRFSSIIRNLALTIDPEQLLICFSRLKPWDSTLQRLTHLVITAPEFASIRKRLLEGELFGQLYPAWQMDAVSVLTLCLFASRYNLAWKSVTDIADMEMTVEMLVQLDLLVQLIESPRFTHVRMQLVKTPRESDLVRSLYGILALLPAQSSAFSLLQTRLQGVATLIHLNI
jgi:vacuole morphology and inheritance protein 14